jgi:squalene monooxygenase
MSVARPRARPPVVSDIAVVGAGPVGCVTALALARQGCRVLLLEADPGASDRLSGEWLHPPAVDSLRRALESSVPCPSVAGHGFVVHPEDGSEPIVLPYACGAMGASCEHSELVSSLRDSVAATTAVRFVPDARVTAIQGERVTFRGEDGREVTSLVERVVGADGRSSSVRRLAGIPNGRTVLSHMAAVVLPDVELPREGFGHVLLGGPGPVLLYRIGPDKLRACIDVPHPLPGPRSARRHLAAAYSCAFPDALVPALLCALRDQPIQWAANQFRTRRRKSHYGLDGTTLVGDAVGHFHPLTAVGFALGFADAECLASSSGLDAYRRERLSRSRVPELLASLLYEAFTRSDEGSVALRRGMYQVWRTDPREREQTMRLLSSEELRTWPLCSSFLKVLGQAFGQVAGDAVLKRELRTSARGIGGLGWWLHRLVSAATSRRLVASKAVASA